MKKEKRWFVSYWPTGCADPACEIKKGEIESILKEYKDDGNTVIFFYRLS